MTSDHTTGARNLAPPPAARPAAATHRQPSFFRSRGDRRRAGGPGAGRDRHLRGNRFRLDGPRRAAPAAISATAVADSAARLRFTAIRLAGTCAGRHTRAAAAAGTPRTSAARRRRLRSEHGLVALPGAPASMRPAASSPGEAEPNGSADDCCGRAVSCARRFSSSQWSSCVWTNSDSGPSPSSRRTWPGTTRPERH